MLFNTRCPVCASTFAVTPETLALASGWVRCGRCANVFEAAAHRPQDASPSPVPVSNPAPVPAGAALPDAALQTSATDDLLDPVQSERRLKRILGKLNRSMDRVKEVTGAPDLAHGDQTNTEQAQAHAIAPSLEAADAHPHIEKRNIKHQPGEHSSTEGGNGVVASADAKKTTTTKTWPKGLTLVLGRFTLLAALVLGLALQAVLAYRTEVATYYPQLRPALQSLCATLGCNVAPLAAPDQLSVETTAFQLLEVPKVGASHQFSWHVRNLALYPVKAPALELSLTDALDRPILRKVLLPRDLGLTDEVIEADGQWVGELPVRVAVPTGAPAIAGYRVIAFYP